jgi:iduronate 2-sulfatase
MKMNRTVVNNTLGIMSFSLLSGCVSGQDNTPARPNILWIFLDDARADGIGSYGKSWVSTPNIDRLAEEGVRFDNAIIQNPVSIPSRRSMKTGFYAYEAGPVAMGKPPEVEGDYFDNQRMKQISESPTLLDSWTKVGMKPVNAGKIHAFHDQFDLREDPPRLFHETGSPTRYFNSNFNIEILDVERVFTDTHGWQLGGIIDVEPEQTETWRLGDLAIDLLDELVKKNEPFFLRVSFHAPHVACYVPPQYYTDPLLIDLPLPDVLDLEKNLNLKKVR